MIEPATARARATNPAGPAAAVATPLEEAVQQFDLVASVAHSTLIEDMERRIVGPLAAAGRAAVREHQNVLRAAGFDRAPAAGRDDVVTREQSWRRVRSYRGAVCSRVLEPLRAQLAELDIARTAAACRADASRMIMDAAAAAPGEFVRDEPAELYKARASDAFARRVRKVLLRGGRAAAAAGRRTANVARRVGRRAPIEPVRRTQAIPIRQLLAYHGAVRLARIGETIVDAACQRLAIPIAAYERELTSWLHVLLEAEAALHHPAQHHVSIAVARHAEENGVSDGADAADSAFHLEAAARAATRLAEALQGLATADPLTGLDADLAARSAAARRVLGEDIDAIGSFMLSAAERAEPVASSRAARAAAEREAHWIEWHRQVLARLELDARLEQFRQHLPASVDALVRDIASAVVEPVLITLDETRAAVAGLRRDIETCCARARGSGDRAAVRELLAGVAASARSELAERVLQPLASRALESRIRDSADGSISETLALLATFPTRLVVHEPPAPDEAPDPDVRPVTVRLREIAEQAYDAVLLERIHVAAEPIAAALNTTRREVRQLETVIRFNLDAALDELSAEKQEPAARLDGAEELALNGIDRTLQTLADQQQALRAELTSLAQRLFEIHARGWGQLHDRVRIEDRVQEQILDFRYRLRSAVRSGVGVATVRGRRTFRHGARLLRLGRGRAQELVRLGHSAVEGERITEEEKRRTIEALSGVAEVIAALPLVYRRLFSFQPVTDPVLLEGRSADLAVIARHFEQWRMGLTDAFVVTGYDGNGRTSFLNVVQETVLRDARVRRIRLTERILDPSMLAARLAAAFDVDDDEPWTLDRCAERIAASMSQDAPAACIIENLEHLFLRTSRDNGLIGPFLAFMSRLDSRVFWLATLAEPAWNYIEKVEPTTARLVRRHALTPLTRADIEAVISNRHLRSGLGLVFEPPEATTPLLRRRLGRARTENERQAVLRSDYFDRLCRFTGQNLLLALFYWIRSVAVDAATSTVRVRPVEPLSFGYIDNSTLSQSFTLKAFLDHATLTLAEHDSIFQVERLESRHIFESLGNLLIIEAADARDRVSEFVFTTIEDDRRYRIRPLLVHPVLMHLRARNMVL